MTQGRGTAGKPATGKPATTGTKVSNLNSAAALRATERSSATGTGRSNSNLVADREFEDWKKREYETLNLDRERGNVAYENEKRAWDNIYGPLKKMELSQDERKNDRNAKSQENVAAQQAAASIYGSKQSADASKYGAKQSADAQKFAAAEGTKQAEAQANAQKFAANLDNQARNYDTQTRGRSEFSGLLANLAAAVGNKSADNTAALLSTAGQVSTAASQSKNADADRMADMYKSIMQTYNTGSGQFRYW
jgi:hypothetical protein